MKHLLAICLGKTLRSLLRLIHRGSALPGLIVERVDATLMPEVLERLPEGVIVVAGTNGKTTTTKLIVDIFRAHGLRVFSNPSGSNYSRGIISSLLGEISITGRLEADIAVLELDEGHAGAFISAVHPRGSLFLNVMRDQLDRYGEIDHTTRLLHDVAAATTEVVVINRDDPRLHSRRFLDAVPAHVTAFGAGPGLRSTFPSDDEALAPDIPEPAMLSEATTLLQLAPTPTVHYEGEVHPFHLRFGGVFNNLNAVAAIAICRNILGRRYNSEQTIATLSQVQPAFGRGETIEYDGVSIELVLVKNPGAFRAALESYAGDGALTMIALNDRDADGRDVSWIWDVDFTPLAGDPVQVVTGSRAADIELRLHYDGVPIKVREPDINRAIKIFTQSPLPRIRRIYCTYTAMLTIRRVLRPGHLGEAA